ncbi:PfkB family carbohydrate kinase, partial [Candidatus Pelagibacter sp.]|nr:PfkB family carbohydrate kinase [Candidatus Pelagibacter sp.]
FSKAKSVSDLLFVSVTTDRYVNKGDGRPYNNIKNRIKVLEKIEDIDFLIESDFPTAEKVLQNLKPNLYCKGSEYQNTDYTENLKKEIKVLKKNNGKVFFTHEETSSSSKIINELLSDDSSILKKYLKEIRSALTFKEIEKEINKVKKSKVLVIGDLIIDEIDSCSIIGKSSKDHHLIVNKESNEKYLGGSAAIANTTAEFSNTTILALVGNDFKKIKLVNKLNKNIKKKIFIEPNSTTITKKRFVEEDTGSKLFGVYNSNNCKLSKKNENKILQFLKKNISHYDRIIVCDYNHNFITKKILDKINIYRKNVYLNSQINANNFGYHSFSKYKKLNFLTSNEKEVRHHLREPNIDIIKLIKKFERKLNFNNLVITRGKSGIVYYNKKDKKILNIPAFGLIPKDRVGAGDTLLSFISLFFNSKQKSTCFFIASLAAAENTKNLFNSKILTKNALLKKIFHLLA